MPDADASIRVLRWKRFVQGDEDRWMENTRRFTARTVSVQVESVNGEGLRPKGAVAANVGAGSAACSADLVVANMFAEAASGQASAREAAARAEQRARRHYQARA